MHAQEAAFRILEAALAEASQGVDEAEIALLGGEVGSTEFDASGIRDAHDRRLELLTVRIAHQGGVSRVATSDFSTDGVAEAIVSAKSRVASLEKGAETNGMLPDPQNYEEVSAYDAATAALGPIERTGLAARAVLAAKERHVSTRGRVRVTRGTFDPDGVPVPYAIANTRGLLAYHPRTRIDVEMEFGHADLGRGRADASSWSRDELDVEEMVELALEQLDVPARHVALRPGRYVAVLEEPAVARLISFLGRTCGARMAAAGASFLSDHLGQSIVDPRVQLEDDFNHPDHRGVPFDVEGVARKRVQIIEEGQARAAVYAWSTAAQMDERPTGHRRAADDFWGYEGASHLVMAGEDNSISELVARVDQGICIRDFESLRLIDSQTVRVIGATRGAPHLIHRGEVAGLAPPMAATVDVIGLLNRIEALGLPRWAAGAVVPPLLVHDLMLT